MRAVWDEHRAGVLAKVDLIERDIATMGTAGLDESDRVEARRSAHMLSGSLGMFGFTRASEAARELELELAEATPSRTPTLSTLLAIVRHELDAEAFAPREPESAALSEQLPSKRRNRRRGSDAQLG